MALTWDNFAGVPWGTCKISLCEYKCSYIWKVRDRVSSSLISFTFFSSSITLPYSLRKLFPSTIVHSIWTGSWLSNLSLTLRVWLYLSLILIIIFVSRISWSWQEGNSSKSKWWLKEECLLFSSLEPMDEWQFSEELRTRHSGYLSHPAKEHFNLYAIILLIPSQEKRMFDNVPLHAYSIANAFTQLCWYFPTFSYICPCLPMILVHITSQQKYHLIH